MKYLARLSAGLMVWGERRGEPGGTGEFRGRGEGDREGVLTHTVHT